MRPSLRAWGLAGDWRATAGGHGYTTEAAGACLELAFGALRLAEVLTFTVLANTRSRAVMRRLGMTREACDDFEHPRLPEGHALRRHVLYRLTRARVAGARGQFSVAPEGPARNWGICLPCPDSSMRLCVRLMRVSSFLALMTHQIAARR